MDQHIDLLPRRLIFENPERTIVRISHDGTKIAFLAPINGVLNLWVGPIDHIEDARPVTKATDRNLQLCSSSSRVTQAAPNGQRVKTELRSI